MALHNFYIQLTKPLAPTLRLSLEAMNLIILANGPVLILIMHVVCLPDV